MTTNDANDANDLNITLYFDGCSKGNPGPGGCGAIIKCNQTYSKLILKTRYF